MKSFDMAGVVVVKLLLDKSDFVMDVLVKVDNGL